MSFINGTQQPDLSRYVTDCYKSGIVIPSATGSTDSLSIPVENDSFQKVSAEGETTEKKSNIGKIVAGATALLAGAAMLFKPTRKWATETLGKVVKNFGESAAKKANGAAEKAVTDILSDEVKTSTKKIKIGGQKVAVHCTGGVLSKKPITFSADQVKHFTAVDGKKGVYKVSLGKDDNGVEQFAEMTLKKTKNKNGEEVHFITNAEKVTPEAPKVDPKAEPKTEEPKVDQKVENKTAEQQAPKTETVVTKTSDEVIKESGFSKSAIKKLAGRMLSGEDLTKVTKYVQGHSDELSAEEIAFAEKFIKSLVKK